MNHLSLIQVCNTRIQSSRVNDDPNETLQQIHNTEQSIVVFGIAAKADAMTNLII
jgi:hypothetical protein